MTLVSCEGTASEKVAEEKKAAEPSQDESEKVEKRGIYGSYGDYHGGDSEGHESHHGHHEHIKTVTIEKKVPVPHYVTKHVPYTVEKKVCSLFFSTKKAININN